MSAAADDDRHEEDFQRQEQPGELYTPYTPKSVPQHNITHIRVRLLVNEYTPPHYTLAADSHPLCWVRPGFREHSGERLFGSRPTRKPCSSEWSTSFTLPFSTKLSSCSRIQDVTVDIATSVTPQCIYHVDLNAPRPPPN
eukprot:2142294-Pyramimonas_sp.AAC.1